MDVTSTRCQLEATKAKLQEVSIELEEVQQYTKRNCLESDGFPYTNSLIASVLKKVNITIKENDISTSHRLEKNEAGRSTPPIILKFVMRCEESNF